jgi:RNA polymerase sigma factor (sigma-70 family)
VVPSKFPDATHKIESLNLANVVSVIPGKSLPNEYVIFSGHYDHLGINSARAVNGDSIYNGANDDAAGTTAMILLSKYYKKLNNNERTLVFAAFTAEEVGGFGAQYFSKQFDPATVKAMFNLEMIGTESKWGRNSAYITGYEKTDMGAILQKNLAGTTFTFYPDPYTDQNLFYRSDNATLARLGVPAHTISTSKMDNEPLNYIQKQKKQGSRLSNDDLFTYENATGSSDEPKSTEIQIALDRSIKQLPEKQRIVFMLRYFEGYDYEKIAGIMGTTVGGAKANFHQAVKKIEKFVTAL